MIPGYYFIIYLQTGVGEESDQPESDENSGYYGDVESLSSGSSEAASDSEDDLSEMFSKGNVERPWYPLKNNNETCIVHISHVSWRFTYAYENVLSGSFTSGPIGDGTRVSMWSSEPREGLTICRCQKMV